MLCYALAYAMLCYACTGTQSHTHGAHHGPTCATKKASRIGSRALAQAHYFTFLAGYLICLFRPSDGYVHIISKYSMQARGREPVPVRAVPGAGAVPAGAGFSHESQKESSQKICFRARNPVSQAVFMAVLDLEMPPRQQTHT